MKLTKQSGRGGEAFLKRKDQFAKSKEVKKEALRASIKKEQTKWA